MIKADSFECPVCHLHYSDAGTAKECEKFCTVNNACSMEIAKKAVEYSAKEKEAVDEG